MLDESEVNETAWSLYHHLGNLWISEVDKNDKKAIQLIKNILLDLKNPKIFIDLIKGL